MDIQIFIFEIRDFYSRFRIIFAVKIYISYTADSVMIIGHLSYIPCNFRFLLSEDFTDSKYCDPDSDIKLVWKRGLQYILKSVWRVCFIKPLIRKLFHLAKKRYMYPVE